MHLVNDFKQSNVIFHLKSGDIAVSKESSTSYKQNTASALSKYFHGSHISYCINIHDLNSHLINTSETIYTSFKQALQECGITDEKQINYLLDSSNLDEFILNLRSKNYANGKQDDFVNKIIQKEPFASNQELRNKISKIDKEKGLWAPLPRRLYDENYTNTRIFLNIWSSLTKINDSAQQKLSSSNCNFKSMVLSNTPQRNVDAIKVVFKKQKEQPISIFCGKERIEDNQNHKPHANYVLGAIKRGLNIDTSEIKKEDIIIMFGDSIKHDGGACLNLSKQGYNTIFVLHDNENVAKTKIEDIKAISEHVPVIVVEGQNADDLTLAGQLIIDSIQKHNKENYNI